MRLDRYVSQALSRPRREVDVEIRRGEVRMAGMIVRDPGLHVILGATRVEHRGRLLAPPGHLALMMHKPAGYETTTRRRLHPTVIELVPPDLAHRRLAPVGRLDLDTSGLLLLTTDGGLAQLLLHPRRHVEKAYLVDIAGELPPDAVEAIAAGLRLGDGSTCLPARLERLEAGTCRLALREGRYHQVKRMIGALGCRVVGLHRERIGPLLLDPALAPGGVRPLSEEERRLLGEAVGRPEPAPSAPGGGEANPAPERLPGEAATGSRPAEEPR
jgi:16S rRNA pseudouridine516 synthase